VALRRRPFIRASSIRRAYLPLDIGLVLAPAIERDSKHFLELAECELDNDVAVSRIIP
jgi:hypothetical protein